MQHVTTTTLILFALGALCLTGCGHKDALADQSRTDQARSFQGDPSKEPAQYRSMSTPHPGPPAGVGKK